jgi:deoxyribodipyrimidine photolyase
MYVLFIFRRDLRIRDNLALNKAIEYSRDNGCKLILAFSFTKEQVTDNTYFSQNSFQFMIESLSDLNEKLNNKMSFFEDRYFYKDLKDIKAIAFNSDYTPYARERDVEIENYCKRNNVTILKAEDYTLHPIDSIKTLDGNTYKVFTPFYKMCMNTQTVDKPKSLNIYKNTLVNMGTLDKLDKYCDNFNKHLNVSGGRDKALSILNFIKKGVYDNYTDKRNDPSHPNSTTQLSAYLKFGNVSIREAYYAIKTRYGKHTDLIKQLYWKEFYANITYHYSRVLSGMSTNNGSGMSTNNGSGMSTNNGSGMSTNNGSGMSTNGSGMSTNGSGMSTNGSGMSTNGSGMSTNDDNNTNSNWTFVEGYNDIKWKLNEEYNKNEKNKDVSLEQFNKWCKGETGFPLVDAGMRQMNKTGFMHNRLRMVTASFLIKDLHIDWRMGEQYFATQLVDYDPASNNGGWQWVAGTGTDASPYFRIFNPWTQIKRFDKECKYIKKWIPELEPVKPTHITKWFDKHKKYPEVEYPRPMVNHDIQKKLVVKLYQ